MGGHYPVFLEPPSSSDTCSSCTPSPEWAGRRHTWSQSSCIPEPLRGSVGARRVGPGQVRAPEGPSPRSEVCLTLTPPPNRSTLVKIPTYQDLNKLTPELSCPGGFRVAHTSYRTGVSRTPPTLPLSAHGRDSAHSKPEPPPRALPAAPPGCFHAGLPAALSSVGPLSSLSSPLSFAAPVGTNQPGQPLAQSDKPPSDFCPSPDASYESMSISHLQRRGEMAASHPLLGRFVYSVCSGAAVPPTPRRGFLSNLTYF